MPAIWIIFAFSILLTGFFSRELLAEKEGDRKLNYCECHGAYTPKSLWWYLSEVGGWRLIAENLTNQQCLEALRYPPCTNPKPD